MTDTAALRMAQQRYIADPTLPLRLFGEAAKAGNQAARNHPSGYEHIHRRLNSERAAAGFVSGGEQLLIAEALHRDMQQKLAEADAEVERQRQAAEQRNIHAQVERARAGIRREWNDKATRPTIEAMRSLRDRLDRIREQLASTAHIDALLTNVDDLENAARSFSTTLAVIKRDLRLLQSQSTNDAQSSLRKAA